jgi:hypothetical protein
MGLEDQVIQLKEIIESQQDEINELRSYINAMLIVGFSYDVCEVDPLLKETKIKTKKYIMKTGSKLLDKVSNENIQMRRKV